MDKIRIKNLRSIIDSKYIELKPITVIVGRNSCGKSTLLRTLPLFKQTIETKTSEPILWYGRYIDFGDYKESKNRNKFDEPIKFEFVFRDYDTIKGKVSEYKLELALLEKNSLEVKIELESEVIRLNYEKDDLSKFVVNDKDIDVSNIISYKPVGSIIPILIDGDGDNTLYNSIISQSKELSDILDDILSKMKFPDEGNKKIYTRHFKEMFIENYFTDRLFDKEIGFLRVYNRKKSDIAAQKEKLVYAKNYILACNINKILRSCNQHLQNYFNKLTYIGPIRAVAERYYRVQGLDLQEVDARGDNVAMIIENMRETEKNTFTEWMKDNFGFYFCTDGNSGNVSMFVCKENEKINIADTGFGYSQIIPIIIGLWKNYICKTNTRKIRVKDIDLVERTIAIEQPELHLHPKMQSQLLRAIANVIDRTRDKYTLKFILETHSEHIINYIGELIANGRISENDVNVIIVDQGNICESIVESTGYDKNGYLEEWPLDFFTGEEM